AMLLTHGYSATSAMWQPNVVALSQRCCLILWDMRGHGQTDSPDDPAAYSEETSVGDITALLEACGAEQAVIGGHSLGGYMSLAFRLAHPERVKALMLIDTGPGFRKDQPREVWNRRAQMTAHALETKGLEALGRSAEVRASQHRSAQGLAHAARGMLAQSDARVIDSLASITVPTLVLAGANDEPFLAGTDYMAGKIPGASKAIIPDAGHAPNIEQPDAFHQAVLAFLDHL
ncbi:MAG: alpha/beta fold hydrolase, partial [Candidatus Binatia bacterium]